jgi:hypothetical protein
LGDLGKQFLRLRTNLKDYPHVVGYSDFIVNVYTVEPLQKLEDMYYQLGRDESVFVFNDFVIYPYLSDFTISYRLQVIDSHGIV